MHKVIFDGKILYASDGTLLSELLMKEGASHEHPCGGKGLCGKCTVQVNGKKELSCKYVIKSDILVEGEKYGGIFSETLSEESGKMTDNLCFALDIGTTTLALALVSLDEKRIVRVKTRTNPQRKFGADIMSRTEYCMHHSVKALQEVLISEVNSMISDFSVETDMLYVTGNTVMLHLFFGIDCSSIGTYPYTPVFLSGKTEDAEKLSLKGVKTVISFPGISSFVGADIVSGLNLTASPEEGKYNLLVDLGTNAEIVLYGKDSLLCTAAAAGPCFEGANISSGMSATDGAVYSYSKGKIRTISDVPARGICGTGLVDVMAELLTNGIIDETGYMENEEFEIAEGVSILRDDVRQYQLAKSAICSAIFCLIKEMDISYEEIDKMYISGGFSGKINIENAVKTGLLPKELSEKCVPLGNSSLLGAVKYIYENNDLSQYINKASYIDLSSDELFSELFIENMMFEE